MRVRIIKAVGAILGLLAMCGLFTAPVGFAAAANAFASFDLAVEIDIEDGEIDMTTHFTLPAGSDEVDLVKETVSLNLAGGRCRYSVTLPAGSFKVDSDGVYLFRGRINKVKIDASLRRLASGTYKFALETAGADLRGIANPINISLTVGKYSGSRSVRALIE